jgi:hypothetical protein
MLLSSPFIISNFSSKKMNFFDVVAKDVYKRADQVDTHHWNHIVWNSTCCVQQSIVLQELSA